ncbi:hypothetical protein PUMCH_002235 [Australozyma saopauloensis]|uniref:Cytochrome b5 heme-binding domain-containing protein n=1 Tax=Australozyma saopauloensis TaxID=291208 RepID=A0AAX4H9I5_9ASCO|nr:hypothetical protein PUMCH_002235 [[Candida] saopauloensis]
MIENQTNSWPVLSPAQVREHSQPDDLWMIVFGKVYDATNLLSIHPGGAEVLIDCAGVDATEAFVDVGHSQDALDMLIPYQVGVVGGYEELKHTPLESKPRVALPKKIPTPTKYSAKVKTKPSKTPECYKRKMFLSAIALFALVFILLLQRQQWVRITS